MQFWTCPLRVLQCTKRIAVNLIEFRWISSIFAFRPSHWWRSSAVCSFSCHWIRGKSSHTSISLVNLHICLENASQFVYGLVVVSAQLQLSFIGFPATNYDSNLYFCSYTVVRSNPKKKTSSLTSMFIFVNEAVVIHRWFTFLQSNDCFWKLLLWSWHI